LNPSSVLMLHIICNLNLKGLKESPAAQLSLQEKFI